MGHPKASWTIFYQGSIGWPRILQALQRVQPLMHCFGHIHEGSGAKIQDWSPKRFQQPTAMTGSEIGLENLYSQPADCTVKRGEQTLMVNAAITDTKNQPLNKPWIVVLELTGSNHMKIGCQADGL